MKPKSLNYNLKDQISNFIFKLMKLKCSSLFFFIIILSCFDLLLSANIKALSKQCLCDVTDQCDSQCCCDSSCDASFIKNWQDYKLCLDDNFGIPFCSKIAQTDKNILDLHSGLRTIYSVVKRLFCISQVNFVQPEDWFVKKLGNNELENQILQKSSSSNEQVSSESKFISGQFAVAGLPLKGSSGICRSSSTLSSNKVYESSCRVFVDSTTLEQSFLSISTLQTSLGITLVKYSALSASTSTSSVSSLPSTTATKCTGSSCENVIKKIVLFVNQQTGKADATGSYLIVGNTTVSQSGYLNVEYEYISVSGNTITVPYESKIGYKIGSKLNLLHKDSNGDYFKIMNPINLAHKTPSGNCRTSAIDPSAASFISLQLGSNQVISCMGQINLLYENILKSFNFIGKYGSSTTKLSSYINVTSVGTISKTQSLQLLIYYVNIGTPQNQQYEISKAQIRSVASKDSLSSLFIEFINVENTIKLYIPPTPTVDAYLPNDFLYPFFVA